MTNSDERNINMIPSYECKKPQIVIVKINNKKYKNFTLNVEPIKIKIKRVLIAVNKIKS